MADKPLVSTANDPTSTQPVLSVRNVSKCYRICHTQGDRLRTAITGRPHGREFWALQNISFDLMPGESVGILGRNGSGKSTLMQIIAGTLAPSAGEVHIRGRIGAMLELGSGFNPHFTGRENAYLSASILGVGRKHMDAQMEEIEEFADIGDFMDEPVSVYSSGMHARLAFAVSVSLNPEILILDEILSVGDAGFQQKCIGRLHQLLDRGVTLLFVSHAADAVKSICKKGVLLSHGKQEYFGTAADAADRYFALLRDEQNSRAMRRGVKVIDVLPQAAPLVSGGPAPSAAGEVGEPEQPCQVSAAPAPGGELATGVRYGTGHARFESVRLLDESGVERKQFAFGELIVVELIFHTPDAAQGVKFRNYDVVIKLRDRTGVELFGFSANEDGPKIKGLASGDRVRITFRFKNILRAGPHGVSVTLVQPPSRVGDGILTLDHIDNAAAFEAMPRSTSVVRGKLAHECEVIWESERLPAIPD